MPRLGLKCLLASTAAAALTLSSAAAAAAAADASPSAAVVSDVVITAQKLDTARASVEPSLGASTYTLSTQTVQALPGGERLGLFGEAPILCHASAVTTAFDVEMIGVFGDGQARGT